MEKAKMLSKGAKVWIILCIVVNTAIIILTLLNDSVRDLYAQMGYMPVFVSLLIVAGYCLLLSGRRIGFLMICSCALIGLIENIILGNLGFQQIASVILNMLLTLLFIGRSWTNLTPVRFTKSYLSMGCMALVLVGAVLTVVFSVSPLGKADPMLSLDGPLSIQDDNGYAIVENSDFITAKAVDSDNGWSVELTLSDNGRERLKQASADYVGKRLHICVGGEVISSPIVSEAIDSQTAMAAGGLSKQQAHDLANAINRNVHKYQSP